jgi:post-segregation antitoxin (ccd killing protein)
MIELLQSADPYAQGVVQVSLSELLERAVTILESKKAVISAQSNTRVRLELASLAIRLEKPELTRQLIRTVDQSSLDDESNTKLFVVRGMLNLDDATGDPRQTARFIESQGTQLSEKSRFDLRLLMERQQNERNTTNIKEREQLLEDARAYGIDSVFYKEALVTVFYGYVSARDFARTDTLFAEAIQNLRGPAQRFALADILLLRSRLETDRSNLSAAIKNAELAESLYRTISGAGSKGVLHSLSIKAVALRKNGEINAARHVYLAAIRESKDSPNGDLAARAKLLFNLSILEAGSRRFDAASTYATDAAKLMYDLKSNNACSFALWAAQFSFDAKRHAQADAWFGRLLTCNSESYERSTMLQLGIRIMARTNLAEALQQLQAAMASSEFQAFAPPNQAEFHALMKQLRRTRNN